MKIKFYWIDLIRFLAAFAVMLGHVKSNAFVEFGKLPMGDKNIFTAIIFAFLRLGNEAVLIFFVLSGFLVGGKTLERTIKGSFDLKQYVIDRGVRIMVPLGATLLLAACIYSIIGKDFSVLQLLGNFFSFQGVLVNVAIEPLWSLAIEVWMYVFIGAACYYFSNKDSKYRYVSLLIIFFCFVMFSFYNIVHLLVWFIGLLMFFYKDSQKSSNRNLLINIFIVAVSLIGIQLSFASRSLNVSQFSKYLDVNTMYLLFSISFSFLVVKIINIAPKRKITIGIEKIGTNLASFSYTLYLTHYIFIYLFKFLGFPKSESITFMSIMLYLVQVFLCTLFSYLIYLITEKKTDKIKVWVKLKLEKIFKLSYL